MASITYSDISDVDLAADARLVHCRRLGLAGAVTLVVGGVLAGVPPMHDPVLQQPVLKALAEFRRIGVILEGREPLFRIFDVLNTCPRHVKAQAYALVLPAVMAPKNWAGPILTEAQQSGLC